MKLVNKFFIKFFGLQIVKHNFIENLIQKAESNVISLEALVNFFGTENDLFNLLKESKSQILQDLFCLFATNFKENGYFVEFGATDGKNLSNTYLLEKRFNWHGILAEPCKKFHSELKNNRSSIIDYRCVYTKSEQEILFKESTLGELSTIMSYSDNDHHKKNRESGIEYSVKTITLEDLLDEYKAPNEIDFLSIDTEGSEFDILNCFNFEKYTFKVIAVEHNYTPNREKIKNLLESKGYNRVLMNVSQWDDWYLRN